MFNYQPLFFRHSSDGSTPGAEVSEAELHNPPFKPEDFEFFTSVTLIYPEYHMAEYVEGISEYTPISEVLNRLLPHRKRREGGDERKEEEEKEEKEGGGGGGKEEEEEEGEYKSWDRHQHYTAENVRVFYPNKWLYRAYHLYSPRVWYEVPPSLTLADVFAQSTYAIPHSCAFYIIDPHSDFFSVFSEF